MPAIVDKLTFRFQARAFSVFLALFALEVFIALFVKDRIIRPYIGDVLVVVLIYYFCASFIRVPKVALLIAVLLFAYSVEIAQYFNLITHLGLDHSRFWTIVIGNSYHWLDMLSYTVGALLAGCTEYFYPIGTR